MDKYELEEMVSEIMAEHGGRALASVRAKIAETQSAINDIRDLDDRLVDKIDVEVEELVRLSSIFNLMFRIDSQIDMGMHSSDIPYGTNEVVLLPATFIGGVAWHESEDEDLRALVGRMKELYDSVHPHKEIYRKRTIEIRHLRSRMDRMREIEKKIQKVIDPYFH